MLRIFVHSEEIGSIFITSFAKIYTQEACQRKLKLISEKDEPRKTDGKKMLSPSTFALNSS